MYGNAFQPNLFAPQNQPMNPYFNPNPQPMQNFNKTQFLVRQVSSIEEAKNFVVDAYNSFLFVDYTNGKIYLKRMNNNGQSDFFTFTIEESKQAKDPIQEINARLSSIENTLGGINVKSISNASESIAGNGPANDVADAKTKSAGLPASTGNDER